MRVWHLCSSFGNQITGALSQGSARPRNTRGKEGGVKKVFVGNLTKIREMD